MNKKTIALIIIAGIILGLLISKALIQNYKPFKINSEGEIIECKSCFCMGQLLVMESYPEQYDCKGFTSCCNASVSQCED
ncbi:hypothetical protein GOV13_03720 [Candidatus Pacearchaeota archaeon]|nr:hypothetical protein [Candidatus Pacearchaeota archaeon]